MEIELTDSPALAGLLEESSKAPALLFLFDPYCPTNSVARDELDGLPVNIHVINVARRHALGMEVQALTGVRHESPQVLLLREGRAAWHASHRGITGERVRAALAEHAGVTTDD